MLNYYNIIYTSLKYSLGMIPYIPNLPNLLDLIEQKRQRDYSRAMDPALERQRIAKKILNNESLNNIEIQDGIRMGFILSSGSYGNSYEINQELLEFYRE